MYSRVQLFIDGEWRDSVSGRFVPVLLLQRKKRSARSPVPIRRTWIVRSPQP